MQFYELFTSSMELWASWRQSLFLLVTGAYAMVCWMAKNSKVISCFKTLKHLTLKCSWTTCLTRHNATHLSCQHLGSKGKWISMKSRWVWSTQWVLDQAGLHTKSLSQNLKEKKVLTLNKHSYEETYLKRHAGSGIVTGNLISDN